MNRITQAMCEQQTNTRAMCEQQPNTRAMCERALTLQVLYHLVFPSAPVKFVWILNQESMDYVFKCRDCFSVVPYLENILISVWWLDLLFCVNITQFNRRKKSKCKYWNINIADIAIIHVFKLIHGHFNFFISNFLMVIFSRNTLQIFLADCTCISILLTFFLVL